MAAATGTRNRNSLRPTKRAIPNSGSASSGIWISGASTAAPPEAARDQLLAEDWAQQEVMASLVANVASAYFTLREQDLQIQISQRTLASDQDSLRLTQLLSDHGAHLVARCAPGRAVGVCRFRRHSHYRKTDPAAGKSDQHFAGRKSRRRDSRVGTDGSTALARSSRGSSVITAGAQARYPRGRSAVDGRERPDRRRTRPRIFLRSVSPVPAVFRVSRSPACSPARRACGPLSASLRNRFSPRAA